MYAREVDDQPLDFGVGGKLIMNALVMYGRQTQSLWSQFTGSAGVLGEENSDDRFMRKEFVLSVNVGDDAMAFPFRHLNDQPIVNETIGDTDVVAVFDPDGATGYAFARAVNGDILTFEPSEGAARLI